MTDKKLTDAEVNRILVEFDKRYEESDFKCGHTEFSGDLDEDDYLCTTCNQSAFLPSIPDYCSSDSPRSLIEGIKNQAFTNNPECFERFVSIFCEQQGIHVTPMDLEAHKALVLRMFFADTKDFAHALASAVAPNTDKGEG